jgi:hydroxyacylglutathione hydrolase
MALRIERIPTLNDNYTYLAICEASGEAAVVDAPEADPVVARVEAAGVRVTKLLTTHHHGDHCMANPALAERYAVPVFGHVSDAGRIPGFTDGLEEGDEVRVGEQCARILHVPAHTSGHIAYVFDEAKAVFSGDTLFAAGCGRLFEGNAEMMFTALVEKLGTLPDETRVFCGHEYTTSNLEFAAHVEPENEAVKRALARVKQVRSRAAPNWHDATPEEMTVPSTIAEEHATNPFMRAGSVDELARRRSLKDSF